MVWLCVIQILVRSGNVGRVTRQKIKQLRFLLVFVLISQLVARPLAGLAGILILVRTGSVAKLGNVNSLHVENVYRHVRASCMLNFSVLQEGCVT